MSVVIPDELIEASRLTASEFRQRIALHLFQTERLTMNHASQFAEMPINTFRQLIVTTQAMTKNC